MKGRSNMSFVMSKSSANKEETQLSLKTSDICLKKKALIANLIDCFCFSQYILMNNENLEKPSASRPDMIAIVSRY